MSPELISEQSLEITREIGDRQGEGQALNNICAIYHERGDYETALRYLEQSLEIRREIGDRSGMCATLFNMGHIHYQNNDHQNAVKQWVTTYCEAMGNNLSYCQTNWLCTGIGCPGKFSKTIRW
ncbi:MAG: hypothetical protein OMM_14746 [Candidatus Magnetoglobus multicellularis str. Araruama]|uniref:Uncharacterized protein n=1 Tax=Candidatus Magnetoglobus multicellularis str. Araruama TaxID=890399 RepID=A0A1V1NRG3_9BACT|nr:MAG: hypothetical protein OMM_14746 [Candidatus Magnetoglobus multicellularis str. Araruama]